MLAQRYIKAAMVLAILVLSRPAWSLSAEEQVNVAAHDRVSPSVVLILVQGIELDPSGFAARIRVSGSGFAVGPGLVITNYHVVESAARIEVVLSDGGRIGAVLVGTAPGLDLALLRVAIPPDRLPPVVLAPSADLRIGHKVLTVSNTFGVWHSMTLGIVSGLNRELPGTELGPNIIQFDAPLNPGQSGGPLVDSDGRVVGVTTAKIQEAEGVGFAIPADVVTRVLPDLEGMGHPFRPRLGFGGTTVTPALADLFDLPARQGVMVEATEPAGIAERAGLREGQRHVFLGGRDYVLGGDIIVGVNGVEVGGSEDLMLRLLDTRPGDEVRLDLVRGNGTASVRLIVPEMFH